MAVPIGDFAQDPRGFQLPVPNSPVQAMDPVFNQRFSMPKPTKKHGMFGNADWGSAISAALNGYLAAGGNPVGQMGLQQLHQKKMDEQRQAAEAAQYQRQLLDQRSNFMFEQDYKAAHPSPVNNDTVADYQFIVDKLGPDEAKNYLRTKTNPVVMTPYGPMPYSAVTGARPEVGAVIDDPRLQGGQTPPASGNFPY